jgi:hypothetical protein
MTTGIMRSDWMLDVDIWLFFCITSFPRRYQLLMAENFQGTEGILNLIKSNFDSSVVL